MSYVFLEVKVMKDVWEAKANRKATSKKQKKTILTKSNSPHKKPMK